MSFFRNHCAPTLHNAGGTLIGAAVLALLAFIKPFRNAIVSGAIHLVPIWCGVVVLLLVAIPLAIHGRRLRARLKAANDKLKELESQLTQQAAAYEAKLQDRDSEQKTRTTKQLDSIVEHQRTNTRFTPRRL
jgi:membrane protein implicated in regulation of membrane protease activity